LIREFFDALRGRQKLAAPSWSVVAAAAKTFRNDGAGAHRFSTLRVMSGWYDTCSEER